MNLKKKKKETMATISWINKNVIDYGIVDFYFTNIFEEVE